MLGKHLPNFAFIDGQNVYLAIRDQDWKLDMKRFRVYLKEKYNVETAYYFLGYIEKNRNLYASLRKAGFTLVFKPTLIQNGVVKGNCDAELVLQAMIDYKQYDKAIIITGDGDFYCLVKYLREQGKLKCVIAPNKRRFSALLKKAAVTHLIYMNELRNKLQYISHKK